MRRQLSSKTLSILSSFSAPNSQTKYKIDRKACKMKFSTTLLPLLTVAAKEKKIKSEDRWPEPSNFRKPCSEFIEEKNRGTFEATGSGTSSGVIRLENYGNTIRCKEIITADASCEAIEIRYRSFAIEEGWDFARFSYEGPSGMKITDEISGCKGDGCQHEDFGDDLYRKDVFFVDSNTFTFYFYADVSGNGGNLIFDWNCIDEYVTTTTTTTTIETRQYTTVPRGPGHPGFDGYDYGTTTTT